MRDAYEVVVYLNGECMGTVNETFTKEAAEAYVKRFVEGGKEAGLNATAKIIYKMNQHEKQVKRLIQEAVSEYIGGNEIMKDDAEEGSEDYEKAVEALRYENCFAYIYDYIMEQTQGTMASHVRFAGREFIEAMSEKRLKAEGITK